MLAEKWFHMTKQPASLFTAIVGIFLLLQGISTLAFRLYPPLDQAFPALLGVTQMILSHSLLHIVTGILALVVLFRSGQSGAFRFAAGFGVFYTALALFGMITHHATFLGLQPFDHPFHLFFGVLGLLVAGWYLYRVRWAREASL
jgi:hypothetical protein